MRADDDVSGRREPGFSGPRIRAADDWDEEPEFEPGGQRPPETLGGESGYGRAPAPRLRFGGYLPAILTGAINLAIPAVLFSTQLLGDNVRRAEQAYLARVAQTGPACALDLSSDKCLCSDFATQADAIAYVAALRRPPEGRFGLYTDDSDTPCAHLPAR